MVTTAGFLAMTALSRRCSAWSVRSPPMPTLTTSASTPFFFSAACNRAAYVWSALTPWRTPRVIESPSATTRTFSSAKSVEGNRNAQPHSSSVQVRDADLMAGLQEGGGDGVRHPTPAGSLDDDFHARKRRPQQLLQEL